MLFALLRYELKEMQNGFGKLQYLKNKKAGEKFTCSYKLYHERILSSEFACIVIL